MVEGNRHSRIAEVQPVDTGKKLVAVIAVVIIVFGLISIVRGCACSRRDPARTLDAANKRWLLVATGGWFLCPECGEKVTLTEEQQELGEPPEMTCPHCGAPVDWAKIGTGKAAEPPPGPSAPKLPSYFDE